MSSGVLRPARTVSYMSTSTRTPASIGSFATYTIGADHYAVEIIAATPKTVTTRGTKTIHIGDTFAVLPNQYGPVRKFTLRADGHWKLVGTTYGFLNFGLVEDRMDPSF